MKTLKQIENLARKECVCNTGDCVHVQAYIKGYTKRQKEVDNLLLEINGLLGKVATEEAAKEFYASELEKQIKKNKS